MENKIKNVLKRFNRIYQGFYFLKYQEKENNSFIYDDLESFKFGSQDFECAFDILSDMLQEANIEIKFAGPYKLICKERVGENNGSN